MSDYEGTRDGTIVCTDGFRPGTMTADEFRALAGTLRVAAEVTEIDESSLFCEIVVPAW